MLESRIASGYFHYCGRVNADPHHAPSHNPTSEPTPYPNDSISYSILAFLLLRTLHRINTGNDPQWPLIFAFKSHFVQTTLKDSHYSNRSEVYL